MSLIAERYRKHADAFEEKVAAVPPGDWEVPSPCEGWTARDVVRHIIDMHAVMVRPLGRELSPAPSVDTDPLAAYRSARKDVEAVLSDPVLAATEVPTPTGTMAAEDSIDQVLSDDLVLHAWDLARATGQDDALDPEDVERIWTATSSIPADFLEKLRTPNAFGPGIVVFGPEVTVPADAPLQDRLLGMIGRDPRWVRAENR